MKNIKRDMATKVSKASHHLNFPQKWFQASSKYFTRKSKIENYVTLRQLQKIPEVRSLRRKPGGEELKAI